MLATYRRVLDAARAFGPVTEEAKKTSIHLVRRTDIPRRRHTTLITDPDTEVRKLISAARESKNANRPPRIAGTWKSGLTFPHKSTGSSPRGCEQRTSSLDHDRSSAEARSA